MGGIGPRERERAQGGGGDSHPSTGSKKRVKEIQSKTETFTKKGRLQHSSVEGGGQILGGVVLILGLLMKEAR